MKRQAIYIVALTFVGLCSCDSTVHQDKSTKLKDTITSDKASLNSVQTETLDSTIKLSDIELSKYQGASLTKNLAKRILYNHFTKKGFFNSDNLPEIGKLSKSDNDKLSVDYDTLFIVDLNNNEKSDAVITYWLIPPYASGHCWQPHKAIIVDTDKGYVVTNEEFIPDNFAIDSLVTKGEQVTIFGYDYDCGNHKILRNLKVKIK